MDTHGFCEVGCAFVGMGWMDANGLRCRSGCTAGWLLKILNILSCGRDDCVADVRWEGRTSATQSHPQDKIFQHPSSRPARPVLVAAAVFSNRVLLKISRACNAQGMWLGKWRQPRVSARVRATSFDGLAEFARLCSRLKKSGAIVRYHKSPSLGFVLELVTKPWRPDSGNRRRFQLRRSLRVMHMSVFFITIVFCSLNIVNAVPIASSTDVNTTLIEGAPCHF